MEYGLIGEHLPHSFSTIIHSKLGNPSYELKELAPTELDSFMKTAPFKGINVTIPYKSVVIPYLDEISDIAGEIGAVNTIVNSNGKLKGYNTDFFGMKNLLDANNIDAKNKKALVLGTGGTSKTASALLLSLGASAVYRVSRSPEKCDNLNMYNKEVLTISYDEAINTHCDAEIIVNTTPVGMYPKTDAAPIKLDPFKKLTAVVDAIYNPLRSSLVASGRKMGIKSTGGLYMLVAQGILASEHFFDTKYEAAYAERIYNEILFERENIVLTGMPGSGKSLIGRLLSEKTGRTVYDTDSLIVSEEGMDIPKIFATKGEAYFRALESRIIKDISSQTGIIISTGGGAVLSPDNIDNLKSNGHIYYIDRDINNIVPTQDRPLSSDFESLKKRYNERHEIYISTADTVISNNSLPEDAVNQILT